MPKHPIGHIPLAAMDRDVDCSWHLIIQVNVDSDRSYGVLLGAQVDHSSFRIDRVERKQFFGNHHRLSATLLFDSRPARKLFEKSLICRHPAVDAIAQYLGGDIFKKIGVGTYKLTVFLIARGILTDQR